MAAQESEMLRLYINFIQGVFFERPNLTASVLVPALDIWKNNEWAGLGGILLKIVEYRKEGLIVEAKK